MTLIVRRLPRARPSATAPGSAQTGPGSSAPPQPDTQLISMEGGQIAYDDTGGSGPLVVCVPGMGDLRSQYRALRTVLQAAGYRVVTMDVRGFGETSADWSDLSARAVAGDVLRLIEHLDAGPAVVLGNSFAAGSCLWAKRLAPDRVAGSVLLGPIVRDGPPNPWMRLLLRIGFAYPWRVAFWMTYWDSLFPSARPADHEQARSALRQNLREPGRMDALWRMVQLSKADTEAMLPLAKGPALVVMGSRDPDFGDATAEARWLARVLGAPCQIVEGAGHYPHLERADVVAPRLLRFLAGVTVRSAERP